MCVKQRWQQSQGVQFDADSVTPEQISAKWAEITQFDTGASNPQAQTDLMGIVMTNFEKKQAAKQSAAASTVAGAAKSSGLKSEGIFNMMAAYLAGGHGKALIPKVDAIFGFQITEKKGAKPSLIYEINLKNGQGHCKQGKPAKADATFTMTDNDFELVCLGKLNPQIAFMQGKMKIAGHMGKASKFTPDLFPPPTPENMAKYAKL